jgi:hypothetical protein
VDTVRAILSTDNLPFARHSDIHAVVIRRARDCSLSVLLPLMDQMSAHVQTHVRWSDSSFLLATGVQRNHLAVNAILILVHLVNSTTIQTLMKNFPLMRVISRSWLLAASSTRGLAQLLSWLQGLEIAVALGEVLIVNSDANLLAVSLLVHDTSSAILLLASRRKLLIGRWRETSLAQWEQHLRRCCHRHDHGVPGSQTGADLLNVAQALSGASSRALATLVDRLVHLLLGHILLLLSARAVKLVARGALRVAVSSPTFNLLVHDESLL